MSSSIHPQARTTPKVRQEIMDSGLSERQIASAYNISRGTARKWLGRDDPQDRSHRPLAPRTTLDPQQQALVLQLRQSLHLTLDQLLLITRNHINPAVSRSGLARCLARHGMARLAPAALPGSGSTSTSVTASPSASASASTSASAAARKGAPSRYGAAELPVHVHRLPTPTDAAPARHLFVATDRSTRWLFAHAYVDAGAASMAEFQRHALANWHKASAGSASR